MSSSRTNSHHRTVTFRLTAWCLILFSVVSLLVMGLAQARLRSILRERTVEDLHEDLLELAADYAAHGVDKLQADFDREANSTGTDEIFLALVTAAGDRRASSNLKPWKGLKLPPDRARDLAAGSFLFLTVTHPKEKEDVRMGCLRLSDGLILCVGVTLEEENDLMEIFNGVLVLALLGMLATGGLMAWVVVRRAMAGVQRVTNTAIQINRDRLGDRVSIGHEGREIEDLALAFNGMLERIDVLVRSLREVTDNLAHDLRSPITRLRGVAETTLTADSRIDDYKSLAASVVEEADDLIAMLSTMLEIAETDSGMARILDNPIDIGQLVRKTHELYQPAAEDHGIKLECDAVSGELVTHGDLSRLQRVMANLLDNAIKHTPRGGTIKMSAELRPGHVAIHVADTGSGIDARDLPRIFERFYRADASRSQQGSGLGLSLSLSIIRAHGGEISVKSVVGSGSTFTVLLPRHPSRA